MKAVVDTNVVAHLLLGTEQRHLDGDANGGATVEEGPVRLGLARRLGIESVATATLCQGALLRAVTAGVPAYDTLFVELAARTNCPLVTFDRVVLRAFPDIARRPREL
jgi:predicted nucleic acid-binding protein